LCLDAADRKSYSGSGTAWNDLSGNNRNGTLTNGPTFSSANGGSIVFDGTNDYVVTNNIDLSGTNKVSIDMWVKVLDYKQVVGSVSVLLELSTNFNNVTTGFYVGFGDDSNAVFNSTYPISINVKGNGSTQLGYNINYWTKTLVNDLNWHHWCCILDKSQSVQETFLYIDGISRTGNTTSYNADNTNNFGNLPFYIGGRAATFNSNVQVSNIKIYNRALSATEVLQNFNAQRGRFGL